MTSATSLIVECANHFSCDYVLFSLCDAVCCAHFDLHSKRIRLSCSRTNCNDSTAVRGNYCNGEPLMTMARIVVVVGNSSTMLNE